MPTKAKPINEDLRYRHGHMVQEYFNKRTTAYAEERRQRLAKIETKKQAQAYVQQVRRAIKKSFGPLPKKTPLNPEITGVNTNKKWTVEKLHYQSRPGFYVTANLYIPANLRGTAPAVLQVCGHTDVAKAGDAYQAVAQDLVQNGFVVLVIDPIEQGEREQFDDKAWVDLPCTRAHNKIGNPMSLTGQFFGTWRVWDAIRGIDYLHTRKEVDTSRIGVTGVSGGGTLTTYVTALDKRVCMAAPCCYICSYEVNMRNEIPADAEQNPPGIIGAGLEEADLLLAYAPRPTLILSETNDFFAFEHAQRAHKEVQHIHALLGHKQNAKFAYGEGVHGYNKGNREAMVKMFRKWAGVPGAYVQSKIDPVPVADLYAAPKGLITRLDNTDIFTLNKTFVPKRKTLTTQQLQKTTKKLLKLATAKGVPSYRALRSPEAYWRPAWSCQYAVETEPGIVTYVTEYSKQPTMMQPATGKVRLFVGHIDSQLDIQEQPFIRSLCKSATPLMAVDPRGIGETMSQSCGDREFFEIYGSDYMFAAYAEMYGETYLGQRVFDVLRVMDFLKSKGASEFELIGRGLGSITMAFVALLHPSKPKVQLFNYLPSYELILDHPLHEWPFSCFIRDVLQHFDLPDVYKSLGKRLKKSKPWDAYMR